MKERLSERVEALRVEVEATTALVKKAGAKAVAVPADVGDAATAPCLLNECLNAFGACDISTLLAAQQQLQPTRMP